MSTNTIPPWAENSIRVVADRKDARIRELESAIAALTEQHRLVSAECRAWRDCAADYYTLHEGWKDQQIATARIESTRAAVDAADALAKGEE